MFSFFNEVHKIPCVSFVLLQLGIVPIQLSIIYLLVAFADTKLSFLQLLVSPFLTMMMNLLSKIVQNKLIYFIDSAVTLSKAAILGITLGALVILLMVLLAACRPHSPPPFLVALHMLYPHWNKHKIWKSFSWLENIRNKFKENFLSEITLTERPVYWFQH